MKLAQWVEEQIQEATRDGVDVPSKQDVLKALSGRCKVSLMTLAPVLRGAKMGNYDKARAVSEATGWRVTIPELCDDNPEQVIGRIIFQHSLERASCPEN